MRKNISLLLIPVFTIFLWACGSGSSSTNAGVGSTQSGGNGGGNSGGGVSAPTVSISADNKTVSAGGSAVLTVTATNATQVVIADNFNSATFTLSGSGGTQPVTLPPTPGSYTFTATASNSGSQTAVASVSITVSAASIQSINHIIFLLQENRSFDNYFGKMNTYRASIGLPADVDDLTDPSEPLNANPAHDGSGNITVYKIKTACIEDLSPSWNESHVSRNLHAQSSTNATMDGFAYAAGGYAAANSLTDVAGKRAMGYYDTTQLNYYYFLAGQFAISDRWFSPTMAKSEPNHIFGLAATSQGWIEVPTAQLSAPTIFNLLQDAGVSWKVYYTDVNKSTGKPDVYVGYFAKLNSLTATHVFPLADYFADLQNGTLPQVALIDAGRDSGLDEHPNSDVQVGAQQSEKVINAFLNSTAYNTGVFIITWDEGGGLYDHVPPPSAVNPDGISPNLAETNGDVRTTFGDNFTYTGMRLPVIVISPFAKQGFVSHTAADYTAILKFIETRFGLPSLTKRDAAQFDMTEFFDFVNVPNATPPTPPVQLTNAPCYYTSLP